MVSQRRLIPLALVGLMSGLAAVGAVIGVMGSPTVDYFAAPAASPGVLSAFRSAVEATLHARSFIVEQDGTVSWYQAPDRSRTGTTVGGVSDITIGSTMYTNNNTFGGVAGGSETASWSKVTYPRDDPPYTLPRLELLSLRLLLSADSVERTRQGFLVNDVVPADTIARGTSGQILFLLDFQTTDGHVSAVRTSQYGEFPKTRVISEPSGFCHGKLCTAVVPFPIPKPQTVTFGAFDSAPPIVPPPASETQVQQCTFSGPKGHETGISCAGSVQP
jgi:hypothetical protein